MNWQFIRAIAEKDLAEVAKNRIAVMGAVVLSLVFAVGVPLLITQIAVMTKESDLSEFDTISAIVPAAQWRDSPRNDSPIVLILGYLIAPLFLVLPLMLSCTIAAEAFVGEKERKTLEAIPHTPATDAELFVGKTLAALIPGIVFTWINFVIFAIVTNLAGYPVMGRIWFPTASWLALMIAVVPAIALLGVSATVIISTKVSTFMEAYQASGALVLLIVMLGVAQSTGLLFLSPSVAVLIGLVFFVIDAVLIQIGIRLFSRSGLITRI